MPNVRVVNVTKKYGNVYALDNVSLTIHDKEYFSLLGPSGCGKTTLLRLIAGLIEHDSGEIYIGDRRVDQDPPEDREVGFVFQTFALFPHMTAWDNVLYGPKVKNYDSKQSETIGHEVLELVKLSERLDAYPSELSGGMMQRIAVARALAAGGKILLLDEPLGQLDAKVRNEIRYEIRRMAKDLKLTAIHVTHDQAEAMSISDRIAVMKKGKIIQIGTPKELYMHPNSIFVAHFIGESNFLEGYITKIKGKYATVELRQGLTVKALNEREIKQEERVVLAIRPETCEMKIGYITAENALQGKIDKTTFEGTIIRYEIRLENGDRFVINRPSLTEDWVEIGQEVTITYPLDKAHLFPYPENGLTNETSV
ncbi:MAG: ABC transporter ATP-binding protein [Candidatus Bathyarchaeota archaeon]|jgi:iron(III) transport system ATP-binding protein|nr:ABC transporter ATP-binding protein [Candidatus Bathyarchaeota archaeon]MDD4326071.1 ABC transporter ATP-binding protein [Candidatus Bathyarchaeota archaeon]MDI9578664.1 ABC transporter ATP-binding protein [Thermoproteota archaeon]MDT8781575.1 ABC transporter ATP-binding protein [Candidatus Bathyarchaeota archaeon]NLD65068.1 ABC transporter ATP-binding protein [Thermoproteota archaeon]